MCLRFEASWKASSQGRWASSVIWARFSDGAIRALTWGKELNTVLFDEQDLEAALSPAHSFRRILDMKLRHAACYGECHRSYGALQDIWGAR
jgi:hypothetical protein